MHFNVHGEPNEVTLIYIWFIILAGNAIFPDVTVCNLHPLWHNARNWGLLAKVYGIEQPLTYDEYIMALVNEIYIKNPGDSHFTT